MNDFEALTDWIQPRHLTPAGVDAYRADFENHPVRMLRLTDFLKEDVAAGLGQFLGREANYRSVYRLHPSSRYTLLISIFRFFIQPMSSKRFVSKERNSR